MESKNDFSAFLAKNQLEHLDSIFAENGIAEVSLLHYVSEDQITKMGIAIGDQLKIKRALDSILSQEELKTPSSNNPEDYCIPIGETVLCLIKLRSI